MLLNREAYLAAVRAACDAIMAEAEREPANVTLWKGTKPREGSDGWVTHEPDGTWGVTINPAARRDGMRLLASSLGI